MEGATIFSLECSQLHYFNFIKANVYLKKKKKLIHAIDANSFSHKCCTECSPAHKTHASVLNLNWRCGL